MNNYKSFILESKKYEFIDNLLKEGLIQYNDEFRKKLLSIANKSVVATMLLNLYHKEFNDADLRQNYINITDKEDGVSFLPQRKFNDIKEKELDADPYSITQRSETRVGRLAKSILSLGEIDVSDKEIEEFVDLFKSTKVIKGEQFKLVKGDDIKYWYHKDNYKTQNGNLGSSCMCKANDYFFDIYAYSKNCSMLILTDYSEEEEREMLIGRALVWNVISEPVIDSNVFMDRIYTAKSSDVNKFKEYANNNNWFYKKVNNHDRFTGMNFIFKDDKIKLRIEVEVDGECDDYPYLDTLKFLNESRNKLSNIGYKNGLILEDTEGQSDVCEICGGSGEYCEICDNRELVRCQSCRGRGDVKCEVCNGTCSIKCDKCEGAGKVDYQVCDKCDGECKMDCTNCDGVGSHECTNCEGEGEVECDVCTKSTKLCRECTGLMSR